MIPILQCGNCRHNKTFKWDLAEDAGEIGILVCSQYPEGITDHV